MNGFEVKEDGIYKKVYIGQTECGEQLIIQKDALVEAMWTWFGIAPKICEYYNRGYCLNTS